MSEKLIFEVADSSDPRAMFNAAKLATLNLLSQIIANIKSEYEKSAPGMTWEQIEYLIQETKKKEPTIVRQEYEV